MGLSVIAADLDWLILGAGSVFPWPQHTSQTRHYNVNHEEWIIMTDWVKQGSKQQLKEHHGETTGLEAAEWSRSHIAYTYGQPSVLHRGISWSNVKGTVCENKSWVLRKVPSNYYLFQSAIAEKLPPYTCSGLKPIISSYSWSYSEIQECMEQSAE